MSARAFGDCRGGGEPGGADGEQPSSRRGSLRERWLRRYASMAHPGVQGKMKAEGHVRNAESSFGPWLPEEHVHPPKITKLWLSWDRVGGRVGQS